MLAAASLPGERWRAGVTGWPAPPGLTYRRKCTGRVTFWWAVVAGHTLPALSREGWRRGREWRAESKGGGRGGGEKRVEQKREEGRARGKGEVELKERITRSKWQGGERRERERKQGKRKGRRGEREEER